MRSNCWKTRRADGAGEFDVYFDPEIGLMPRRIEEIRGGDAAELTNVLRLMDYEEVKPGLWFPTRIEEEGHGHGEIFTRNVYLVRSLEVNHDVADELFDLEFPAGTDVYDEILGASYNSADAAQNVAKDLALAETESSPEQLSADGRPPQSQPRQGGGSDAASRRGISGFGRNAVVVCALIGAACVVALVVIAVGRRRASQ